MEWDAPYLVAALGALGAVEFAYAVTMVVTGVRHRAAVRRRGAGTGGPPGTSAPDLTPEELGLLSGGARRMAEVGLLRMYLNRDVILETGGWVSPSPGAVRETRDAPEAGDADAGPPDVRRTMLNSLVRARRQRSRLMDVLWEGAHGAGTGTEHRRLVSLGLLDDADARICRTRERAVGYYAIVVSLCLIVCVVCLTIASTGGRPEGAEGGLDGDVVLSVLGLLGQLILVTVVFSKATGGRLRPAAPGGTASLAREARGTPGARAARPPSGSRDALLRYVASHGLGALDRFESPRGSSATRGGAGDDLRKLTTFMSAYAEALSAAGAVAGADGGGGG